MKNYVTLFFILTALTFGGCKKGENGTDGAKGEKGEQGLKGADGSTIHSGTGAPAGSLGNVGDFYLDKNTAELYGPKTATGWPTPISLKGSTGATGATGAAGAAGSKILSGTTAPALGIGAEGDFYFDTANLNFYGPKTATSWGSAISLGASNGITTLLYSNQSFDNITFERSDTVSLGGGIPKFAQYFYNGTKTLNISNTSYLNAYNTGLIYVRLKLSNDNDSSWSVQLDKFSGNYNSNSYSSIYIGDDDDTGLIKKNKVILEGSLTTTTNSDTELRNFKFDVKVVCIPAGTVVQMSAKNIDVKDAKAVAKFLNL